MLTRHSPCLFAECMFDTRADIATQLSIPEILQLNRHSHRIAILSKAECPFAVATDRTVLALVAIVGAVELHVTKAVRSYVPPLL